MSTHIDRAHWPFDRLRANGEGIGEGISPDRAEPVEAPAFPYAELARLLEYPAAPLGNAAEACRRALAPRSEEAAAELLAFGVWIQSVPLVDAQETYARTFDFNPALCLDLGYQLFGESYKRGVFLVKVQAAVRAHGIAFAPELADSLPVVLRLLPKLGRDDARSLVDEVVLPAVAKLLGALTDPGNPYRVVLEALERALCAEYGITRIRPLPEERPIGEVR